MNEVYELEVWSQPGKNLPAEFGKELKAEIDSNLSLKAEVFIGLSFIPSTTDTTNLLHALNESELKIGDFERYCKLNNCEPSVSVHTSAAKYLEFSYGRALAWLHIPHSSEGLVVLNRIMQWATGNGYNLQCGQQLYCLLSSSNEMPLNW